MYAKYLIVVTLSLIFNDLTAQTDYWAISDNREISLDLTNKEHLPYEDNIEMSGKRVSGIIAYKIDKKKDVTISREIFFPQLRTYIKTNDPEGKKYRAYLKHTYSDDILPALTIHDKIYAPGKVKKVSINGMLEIEYEPVAGVSLFRAFFPSMTERLFIEQWTLVNRTNDKVELNGANNSIHTNVKGVKGSYSIFVNSNIKQVINLLPGGSYSFSIGISATLNQEKEVVIKGREYFDERKAFLYKLGSSLKLITPDSVLNTLFEFSKIRASESIFESKLGLIHSPGGGRYYVGFWANDEGEYAGPFFPYLGYKPGNDAALNMYRLFKNETNKEYKNIRYSFEMEGDAPINHKDRGDAAMIAFGAAQFALARGNRTIAEELWPLITWCLEYNKRHLNKDGVVLSESDEMEGRIPTGSANLSTSSLYYGSLNLAVSLGNSLNKSGILIEEYERSAKTLKSSINNYFGAEIDGLATYKYYKEHTQLRHWICLPLVVQIFDRKDGTIKALFEKLWTENGVHVENNNENVAISKTFWDRGTLYALRGTFLAGATMESLQKLTQFSHKRLLGNRVPYVVEAYPEGNMAHLSAESALYCRVFTEGIFGIRPTGLKRFISTPRLPVNWPQMELLHVKSFGDDFNILVKRVGIKLLVKVTNMNEKVVFENIINDGESVTVSL